ncbi:hypothetical protein FOC4_g10013916 [Fusarium odoratissimum]|uniref:Uncharacterized protein n=1 Tax=Fusarium oxysporum f. sp. cubense (strain race 4) TaxID=2502994 RepID=N1RDS0_FUSC4|nr:hypothetical protein FOC4_g10013916 [Fusarium odoratissimum]
MIQNGSKRQKPVVSRHCWNMYPDLRQIYIARCESRSGSRATTATQVVPKFLARPSHAGAGLTRTWVVQTHAPVPWVDHGNDYGVGVQGDKKKWNTHLRNARSMANDNKILSTPQGWRFGELVAHEAEEGNHIRSFFPVSHCGCVIWIYKRKPFTPDFWVGLLDQPVSILNHIHHTKHTLSTYFLLLSIDRRL